MSKKKKPTPNKQTQWGKVNITHQHLCEIYNFLFSIFLPEQNWIKLTYVLSLDHGPSDHLRFFIGWEPYIDLLDTKQQLVLFTQYFKGEWSKHPMKNRSFYSDNPIDKRDNPTFRHKYNRLWKKDISIDLTT